MLRGLIPLLLGLLLTGCGQKGDLYLPPQPQQLALEQPSQQSAIPQQS